MYRFFVAQLIHRRHRLAALGTGLLIASLSFVLLTSAVATTQLEVTGTVARHFRPAYDVLVRAEESYTNLERRQGLVRSNYLSGLLGGITFKQYATVRSLRGVEVAAPIANIGYIMPFEFVTLRINRFLSDASVQLFRLQSAWEANNGLSKYPGESHYVYYTRENPLVRTEFGVTERVDGRALPVCDGFSRGLPFDDVTEPFDLRTRSGFTCFSELSPNLASSETDYGQFPSGTVGAVESVQLPVFVAAIDPQQEARLVDFRETLVGGRLLKSRERPFVTRLSSVSKLSVIPVLASEKSYVDEKMVVSVERLETPKPAALRAILADPKRAYRFTTGQQGEVVGEIEVRVASVLRRMVRGPSRAKVDPGLNYNGYWSAGSTDYRESQGRLRPLVKRNPKITFQSGYYGGGWAPQENRDVQFRKLRFYEGSNQFQPGNVYGTPALRVVGQFDPELLPGFSRLSQVPLETYYPPKVEPANSPSRQALGGAALLPTVNIGGYVAQPPLILTNLQGLKALIDPDNFPTTDPAAPISVIRVRVEGVKGPDPVSRERIKRVATEIHRRTGLAVDITAGSSPRSLLVELPEGKFGQPPLVVREGWVEKGVAIRFLKAVDRKSLFLFFLVLLVCALFLANATLASVRSRRREIGSMLCLGWSQREVFTAVLGELALVGCVAGVAGVVLAGALTALLDLPLDVMRVVLVLPVSIVLAVAAGLLPARRAARGTPMEVVQPAVSQGGRRRPVTRLVGLALRNLIRTPARTVLAMVGLLLGVGALTALIALNQGFQRTLVGTLLGNAIAVDVRGVDFVSVVLVTTLGAVSVADLLYLNIKERQGELVALRTLGWDDKDLAGLVVMEGMLMGLIGSLLGAALGVGGVALVRGIPVGPILSSAGIAAAGGVVATSLASLAPAARMSSLIPVRALAEEQ